VAVRVVDETGCGNAFCGAFAASVASGDGIAEGLALGHAAASIMLEHVGVPPGGFEEYREEAERRAARARAATTAFSL
jgi:ribokinase